jgi:hypothetical protein
VIYFPEFQPEESLMRRATMSTHASTQLSFECFSPRCMPHFVKLTWSDGYLLSVLYLQDWQSNFTNTFPVSQTHFTVALLSNTFLHVPRCNRSPHSFLFPFDPWRRSQNSAVFFFFSFSPRRAVFLHILGSKFPLESRETQLGQSGTDWQKAGGFSGFLSCW